jgi:hypothetical protein
MTLLLAHMTVVEWPSLLLAALFGFIAGVAVTYAMAMRKLK